MSTNHLQIRNLNVRYGSRQVLNDISLDIPNQKITAIIGPSGCGKSTLLKSMNRLLEVRNHADVSGKVLVDGENIYRNDIDVTRIRRKMGLLSQRPQVLPMSIYENVAYGLRIHGERNRKKLNEVVERFLRIAGLWDEVHDRLPHPASELSIGQQQRLCLARGLAVGPEIILADEPTSALDPTSSRHVETCLKTLKSEYTILFVTHILRQAKRIADYVVFIYLGRIIETGTAEEIFQNPKEELTRRYIEGDIS